ncbi:MAG: transglycosylase domain-containing protein [Candidatus Pacebacteria bacterium]|nr:transglycosylase domain-containing protein [Candidatus Paceibacterota bacterium]
MLLLLKKHQKSLTISLLLIIFLFVTLYLVARDAEEKFQDQLSLVITDRNEIPLSIKENSRGHYVYQTTSLPEEFKRLLIQKEDRFFYYHPGVNPVSTIRALYALVAHGNAGGASTITQQLAKNLLGTESERTITNKFREIFYALGLELFATKEEILLMYANTVYLGNQTQGFETASYAYFGKPLRDTTHSEQIALLATLSHPGTRNPWEEESEKFASVLNARISPNSIFNPPETTESYSFQSDSYFEIRTAAIECNSSCATTIDDDISKDLRNILDRHIEDNWSRNVRNGAIVVIDAHTSELLAMIGSRDPKSEQNGNQINMALEPRPIGSTIKPFIYAKGFEKGLRPYSLVEDREYKYPIATGFSLYPKNYDGQYRGEVTLHEALSNSLNVPSVKILEYIGLTDFYRFLSNDLQFEPIQDYDSYQYGIALGGLEMDLTTLTHYFTLFPNKGSLSPLKVIRASDENFDLPPQSHLTEKKTVLSEEAVELVHTIISDRYSGVNQFGLNGNLNLTQPGYGVKTGTSRDFHDSWVVGYTLDFVVGVWIGNTENTALDQVSGSTGAGAVWHDVMEYLLATPYNQHTSFNPVHLERFMIENSDEWGLRGDVVSEHQNLLQEDNLILSIHTGDTFELFPRLSIPLKARRSVMWSINGQELAVATETTFNPEELGTYEIAAFDTEQQKREILLIEVTKPE